MHNLRSTWASWDERNGTPLPVLQELDGWADLSMVTKYTHLGVSCIAEYVNNVSTFGMNVTESPQEQKQG